MRPDIEDFEELNIPADDAPRSRAMSWLVLAVAVGGFGALAYYAYHSGTQSMQNGDVLVVQADEAPIKEVPADTGGEQFANQDKTIYDVIAPNSAEGKVEKLLPEPEKPVAAPQEVVTSPAPSPNTTTYVNKNLSTPSSMSSEPPKEALKPAPLVVPVPSSTVTEVKPSPTAPVVKKVETKPAPTSAAPVAKIESKAVEAKPTAVETANVENDPVPGEPNFVNESTVTEGKPEPAPKPVKEAKKEEAKPAAKGAYQVQLGAFKSEDEARAAWKKLSSKHSSVLTGSPNIVKADLSSGTFYRLRAGSYASADAAKAACAKLGGQACFPAK